MDILMEYLPVLIPLVIVELGIAAAALVHVLRHRRYRFGNRVMWIVIILFIQIVGPVMYFVFGRGEEE